VGKLNAETNTAETPDYRTTDIIVLHLSCRYITKEELEQALKEQGLYDAEKIKEVISDADSDNVRNKYCVNLVGIINNRNYSIINVTKGELDRIESSRSNDKIVLLLIIYTLLVKTLRFIFAHVGWKDRLFRVCGDDEERDSWC
jgi:hypothetical protein